MSQVQNSLATNSLLPEVANINSSKKNDSLAYLQKLTIKYEMLGSMWTDLCLLGSWMECDKLGTC